MRARGHCVILILRVAHHVILSGFEVHKLFIPEFERRKTLFMSVWHPVPRRQPRPLPASATDRSGFSVLKERDFTLYLGARLSSATAAQMLMVAVGWQVYHITGRVLDLGLIGLSQFLPFLCFSLIAGHAADRYDRGLIISACLLTLWIAALLLLFFAARGIDSILPIFGVLALMGIARSFLSPAAQSFVPTVVPVAGLGNAIALNSSLTQVATIVGPSIGGMVYAVGAASSGINGGAKWVYGAAAGVLLLAFSMMLLVSRRGGGVARSAVSWSSMLDGLRFVLRRRTVLGAISLDLFAVLFGGATALLPAFTQDVLHAGPDAFGYLRAAPGIGAGLCALWLAMKPITRWVGVYMFAGVAMFGMSTVIFGLTRYFWVAMTALVLLGAGDMLSVFIRTLLVQLETPNDIRGRVSAVNSVFIGASNELGEFESGFTAACFGLVPAIVLGGAATLVIAALWAGVLFPNLWHLQGFDQLKAGDAEGT
ncbi:MAG: Major facilitator superfamily 1 [Gammaproteobacteria bacterium]|nr:Major facilitator superfamily 1 [Gammaproteobacteria bacterium]